MDPNKNLEEQLEIARLIMRSPEMDSSELERLADRLAELVVSLDAWLFGGGFKPSRWPK